MYTDAEIYKVDGLNINYYNNNCKLFKYNKHDPTKRQFITLKRLHLELDTTNWPYFFGFDDGEKMRLKDELCIEVKDERKLYGLLHKIQCEILRWNDDRKQKEKENQMNLQNSVR